MKLLKNCGYNLQQLVEELSGLATVDGKTWVDQEISSLHFCKMGTKHTRHYKQENGDSHMYLQFIS